MSLTALGLLAAAIAVSNLTLATTTGVGATGGTSGAGEEPRLAVGGDVAGIQEAPAGDGDGFSFEGPGARAEASASARGAVAREQSTSNGRFGPDGTLRKPTSVAPTVADGKALLRTYRVRAGDTLTGIASRFDVSMMTVWWANNLTSKTDLRVGQVLTIPPVSGVIVTVAASDTLDSLARRYDVQASDIRAVNHLDDPVLIVGQTLTIPGARSTAIPTPKPTPAPTKKPVKAGGGSSGGSTRPPSTYTGGAFAWPVGPGGQLSQGFHGGHAALDIAADRGVRVSAAARGTVIFAGWKSNGGGYQVWIAHGSNLYTTYNHMSSVSVGRGQQVARGQQVGRVGATGNVTGSHLHFEVWRGRIWDGGTRVNPFNYL